MQVLPYSAIMLQTQFHLMLHVFCWLCNFVVTGVHQTHCNVPGVTWRVVTYTHSQSHEAAAQRDVVTTGVVMVLLRTNFSSEEATEQLLTCIIQY